MSASSRTSDLLGSDMLDYLRIGGTETELAPAFPAIAFFAIFWFVSLAVSLVLVL